MSAKANNGYCATLLSVNIDKKHSLKYKNNQISITNYQYSKQKTNRDNPPNQILKQISL